jgi:hypothetical protein
MTQQQNPTAVRKRSDNQETLARFSLLHLRPRLPLRFPLDPNLPPSPKHRYRSHYRYLDAEGLEDPQILETLSPFDVALRLIDYAHLEPLLAAHIYTPSAKGQVPFHPVSMYLLRVYRRAQGLSRTETLRILKSKEGAELRRRLGFEDQFPTESGLRYFEKQLMPPLQWEINALQVEMLYQAGLLPTCPHEAHKVSLSFDGMLHQARSRMRCAHVREGCYQDAPRPCPARKKDKRGCDCTAPLCAQFCRHGTPRDPEARLMVYSGNNKRAPDNPNASTQDKDKKSSRARLVYGYYSYAGQILDLELATYWILPAAFGAATTDDRTLFPNNWIALRARFPWLHIEAVLADAGAGYQCCLDPIWEAKALRLVDIRADKGDKDPETQLQRGYDDKGYPLCPFGYVCHPNGHDYDRRLTKWRCAKACLHDAERPVPACDYLGPQHKHGYTTTVGRTHADGSVRLAREIPYGSPTWKKLYHRRNCAESRNSIQQRLGLKRLPVHGLACAYSQVLLGDFVANQQTLIRLFRQATSLLPDEFRER